MTSAACKWFEKNTKHWSCIGNWSTTLLSCRSHELSVSHHPEPRPHLFDHTSILSLPTALPFVNYLAAGVGSRLLNWWVREWLPVLKAEDLGSKPQQIIKGYKRDVVIYYIWGYKIIYFTIKMIIPVYLSVISNVKPSLCIFSCGLSSWFIESYWL